MASRRSIFAMRLGGTMNLFVLTYRSSLRPTKLRVGLCAESWHEEVASRAMPPACNLCPAHARRAGVHVVTCKYCLSNEGGIGMVFR